MVDEAENYKKNRGYDWKRKDDFHFNFVKVMGNIAYTVYSLKSEISKDGKLTLKNWNESVIFRKEKGVWKIALIHSTPSNL